MTDSDTHCIRRLRFRGALSNSPLARHRVKAALAEGASGSRLEKEAILCVRRLGITLRRIDRLKDALDAESLAAARPARGPVPANANAVLFADRAELLACLARDWCAGSASVSWWWPVLFPKDDITAVARRVWLEEARSVPAALERLESAGLAAKFLAKLSPGDVATLWRKLVDTFDLAALGAAMSDPGFAAARPPSGSRQHDAAPWAPWITIDPSVETDVARLLITGVLLARAPAKVRSTSFAREIRAWRQSTKTRSVSKLEFRDHAPAAPNLLDNNDGPAMPPRFIDTFSSAQDAGIKNALPQVEPKPATLRPPHHKLSPGDERGAAESRLIAGEEVAGPAATPSPPQARSANFPTHETQPRNVSFRQSEPIDAHATDTESAPPDIVLRDGSADDPTAPSSNTEPANEIVALPGADLPDRIATEWGGVLYLTGVAISLGYYGDFTSPARPGLALPLWDFLALVGAQFAGEPFKEDPLYALFARLSGRFEKEPPGADFEVPTGEPLEIWIDRICDELHARVAASLGLDHECDFRPLVLNHHARIEADAARVNAHFSLAIHPIELRVAGLDRDPGWVPAAGRSIYFHYD
ncbi:MAG TPA: hypothetical protein VEX43_01980 [Chthoniobacterales bacterium]|nr:hypothetical protein [Chthoniobacterales bacterium]